MKTGADQKSMLLHGTAVVLKDAAHPPAAVFLRGLSGSGKSDLAFRLISACGAVLLGDDQVAFERRQEMLYALPVESIRGLLEVRGLGLFRYPVAETARLRLVIELVRQEEVPRLPEWETVPLLGVAIPRLRLHAFEASAALKVVKALQTALRPEALVQ